MQRWLCLACVLDVFTRHMGLTPAKAQLEIRRYLPPPEELSSGTPRRPYFSPTPGDTDCPHCRAPQRWLTAFDITRIESGKATDAHRRKLVASLPKAGGRFQVVEEKATQREAFFDWLDKTSASLDLDSSAWLLEAAHHWLARKFPKHDWSEVFPQLTAIRRSRRIEEGWEVDGGRLYVAPPIFDEILLVQYLLSRSHKSGGLTFEGRFTLHDLFHRLRGGGYLRTVGVINNNPSDAFEELVDLLGGGEAGMKFYYIVDRRAFLEKLKLLSSARLPKPKET
jgi:hypothetical protein